MKSAFPISLLMVLLVALVGCKPSAQRGSAVVVYTSVDDVFARPVCEQFTKQTGIEVKLVPDTEETKSTGLLNRLIAEKNRPQADVFWSGDPVRAAVLKRQGISAAYRPRNPADTTGRFSDPEGHWAALSARARVIIWNTDVIAPGEEPRSLRDFLDPKWKGKACLANPLFGTTSMHAAALFETLGEPGAREFFTGLRANDVRMLSSNGEVKRRVASGEYAFGLTDTDDASVAVKEGKPVGVIYPDTSGAGTLIVPNAAVLIAGAPHPDEAKKFIEYLLSAEVEQALAASEAAQMPLRPGVPVPPGVRRLDEIAALTVDYGTLAERLETLSRGFLKEWTAQP
jgi:iron(III) transport system substrate-binding protein